MPRHEIATVAQQYERFPFPRIPLLAKPVLAAAYPIAYEYGQYLRTGYFQPHTRSTRILVAGSGTFEPLVLARVHPRAQIVAVDFSAAALKILRRRAWLSGLGHRITTIQADLHDDLTAKLGHFDYVVCTGVIHHSPTPELILKRLSAVLNPNGVCRIMIYAAQSRLWIYEVQDFFKRAGLTASDKNLARSCAKLIHSLSPTDPLRTSFETYSDATTAPGLVDGFFHVCDKPIQISKLREFTEAADLHLLGFGHAWHSQPNGFSAALKLAVASPTLFTNFSALDAWQRLAVLDHLRELSVNPVFWLSPRCERVKAGTPSKVVRNPALSHGATWRKIAAPLAPTHNGELVRRLRARDFKPSKSDSNDYIEAGLWLGDDGTLPFALTANRCTLIADRSALAANRCADTTNPTTHSGQLGNNRVSGADHLKLTSLKLAQPQLKILAGLQTAVATLDPANELTPEALVSSLVALLESRVNRQGRELPQLSSGDLLRELRTRGISDTEIADMLRRP